MISWNLTHMVQWCHGMHCTAALKHSLAQLSNTDLAYPTQSILNQWISALKEVLFVYSPRLSDQDILSDDELIFYSMTIAILKGDFKK